MKPAVILVVEDEAIVAADIASKVRELGFDVVGPVATGEEAVALARERRPALVLMDIRLAGPMDGIAAAQEIRKTCPVPVVFLTAHSDQATVERARETDAFSYILKPFGERDLQIQIELALYKHAAEQRLRDLAADLERRVVERTAELQASEARFRALVEQVPAATYSVALDRSGATLYMSPQIEKMLGFTPAEFVADPALWRNQLHPEDRARVLQELQDALRLRRPCVSEYRICRREGRVIWVQDFATPIEGHDGQPALLQGVVFDVTERAELQRQVLHISERERRRLGQDLHDSVVQTLTGIRYLIAALQLSMDGTSAPEAGRLERIGQLVEKSVKEAELLSLGLFPGELGRGHIVDGLQDLARHTQDVYGITCSCTARVAATWADANVVSQMYRIAQEAVFNAARHSQGKAIDITLAEEQGRIVLAVRDNGIGFVPEVSQTRGMGQRILKYRADAIGATLRIDSAPGRGATVTCTLPVPVAPAES